MQHFIKWHNAWLCFYALNVSSNFYYYNSWSLKKNTGLLKYLLCILSPPASSPPLQCSVVFNCAMVCLYDRELLLSHFVVLLPSNLGLRVIWSLENGENQIFLQHLKNQNTKKPPLKKTQNNKPHQELARSFQSSLGFLFNVLDNTVLHILCS